MFIFDMIYFAIVSNIGLIAFTIISLSTVAIAIWGEKWLEAIFAKNPEFWDTERDFSIKAIWNRFKK